MKFYSRIIQQTMRFFHAESVLIFLSRFFTVFEKAFPAPSFYPIKTIKKVVRDEVSFELNICDYMQWHVYFSIPEKSHEYASLLADNNSVIIDVGANIGAFSLKLSNLLKKKHSNFKIHSFEPNPEIFSLLKNNVAHNPELSKHIQIHTFGLGNQAGKAELTVSKINSGAGKIQTINSPDTASNNYSIEIITLDAFAEANSLTDISFIKIDVEGFEPMVIKGAEQTIRKHLPSLYIEMTNYLFEKTGSSQFEIINFLKNLDYLLLVNDGKKTKLIEFYNNSLPDQYDLLAVSIKHKDKKIF